MSKLIITLLCGRKYLATLQGNYAICLINHVIIKEEIFVNIFDCLKLVS